MKNEIVWRWVEKDFFIQDESTGKYERLKRNQMVERVIATCIALWDHYKEPDSGKNQTLGLSRKTSQGTGGLSLRPRTDNNDTLVVLCSELEAAMEHELTERDRNVLFDTFYNQLQNKELQKKYGVSSNSVVKSFRETPLVKLSHRLQLTWRWDTLGEQFQ